MTTLLDLYIGAATWERCSAFAARYPKILICTIVAFAVLPNISALAVSRVIDVVSDSFFSAKGCAVEAVLQAAGTTGKSEARVAAKLEDILTKKHVRKPWQAPGDITETPSTVPQQPVHPPTTIGFLTQIWLCALSVMIGACCYGRYGGIGD